MDGSGSSTLCDLTCPPRTFSIITRAWQGGIGLARHVGYSAADQREDGGKCLKTPETVRRKRDAGDGNRCWIKHHFDWELVDRLLAKTWKSDLELALSLSPSPAFSQTHTSQGETHTWVSTHMSVSLPFRALFSTVTYTTSQSVGRATSK